MTDKHTLSFIVTVTSILIIVSFCFSSTAEAVDYTSTNFIVRDPNFGTGGTSLATSSSFELTGMAGDTAPGTSTSATFNTQSGSQYTDSATLRSANWQWFDDANNETPASSLAAENVAPSDIQNNSTIKLRLTLQNIAGVNAADTKIRLQFSEYADFSAGVENVAEVGDCTGNTLWCYGDGVDADNDPISTLLLTDSSVLGTHNESGTTTTTLGFDADTSTEMEFSIKSDGPRVNRTYYFRAFNASTSEAIPIATGETYPSLQVGGSNLTFTIEGLPSGTSTEGVVTDITTDPTSVSFNSIAAGNQTNAAQRLRVATNATEGYQLFVFESQDLLNGYGGRIDPVTGTNASPTTWAAGCPGSQDGCYGYHTGDDTLAGGSARFAADNSYAQFDSTPREVGYSATPTDGETIDMVYRVAVQDTQSSGTYQSGIAYVIVPVF